MHLQTRSLQSHPAGAESKRQTWRAEQKLVKRSQKEIWAANGFEVRFRFTDQDQGSSAGLSMNVAGSEASLLLERGS